MPTSADWFVVLIGTGLFLFLFLVFHTKYHQRASRLEQVGGFSRSRLDLKGSFCPKQYVPKRVSGHVSSECSFLPDPSFAEFPGGTPVDTMITALNQLVSGV